MKIFKVLRVTVIKVSESPLTLSIQAEGLAATSGWTNPRLDNSADPNPDDSILEFNFDADRPSGISLPQLTPIMATVDFEPSNGADAVIVSARINSITVDAGEFLNPGDSPAQPTTLAFGEEDPGPTTRALGEEGPSPDFTTQAFGEEEPSSRALGEEGPPQPPQPTTYAFGEEEDPRVTTLALGEEGEPTSRALGEEGPPQPPQPTTRAVGEEEPQFTTYALGEEEPSTRAAGEESQPTTRAVGEEQPEFTTLAIGEESSPFGRY